MKKILSTIFICIHSFVFCQEKLIEERDVLQNDIEIIADGLDDIIIENSESNKMVVVLFHENLNTHNIFFNEEDGVLRVQFEFNFNTYKKEVFRKYITKRLKKASVVIKIPQNKNIAVYGKTISVTSKSYQGDLSIFIDRGNIQLNNIKGNTNVSLFLGNVFAKLNDNSNVNITTTKGKIVVNKEVYKSRYSHKSDNKTSFNFKVNSINGNVNLITE